MRDGDVHVLHKVFEVLVCKCFQFHRGGPNIFYEGSSEHYYDSGGGGGDYI